MTNDLEILSRVAEIRFLLVSVVCLAAVIALSLEPRIRGRWLFITSIGLIWASFAGLLVPGFLFRKRVMSTESLMFFRASCGVVFHLFAVVGFSLLLLFINTTARTDAAATQMPLKKILFSFRGRVSRQSFWLTWVAASAPSLFLSLCLGAGVYSSSDARIFGIFSVLLLPLTIWANLAVQVKRWHDLGRSGWMLLVSLIPALGPLYTLMLLGFSRGSSGQNQYGDEPQK